MTRITMATTDLSFLFWVLNLSEVAAAGVVAKILMTRLIPVEMAVTAEAVMVALELPARAMQ